MPRLTPSLLSRPLPLLVRVACFLAAAVASLPSPAAAQTPPPPPPAKLRFLFIDENPGGYALKVGEHYRTVSSTPYAISPVVTPPAPGPLELYRVSPLPSPETGQPVRVKILALSPPASLRAALVIVTPRRPDPGSPAPVSWEVEYIDDAPSAYPAGSLRVINRAPGPLAAQFGAHQIQLEAGRTTVVRPQPDRRNRVFTKIAALSGSGWQLINDSITVLRPDHRVTGLFFHSASGMRHFYTAEELREMGGAPPPTHVWLTYSDAP